MDAQTTPRAYRGVDRGFLFVDQVGGFPWNGLTDVSESESGGRLEKYFLDGRSYFKNYVSGNYNCSITALTDPFEEHDLDRWSSIFGFSYRENFEQDGEDHYRLHIVYGLTFRFEGSTAETVNHTGGTGVYSWTGETIPVDLDGATGSHIILDSTIIYPWVLRDIEAFLYGYPNGPGSLPTLNDIYEFLETMNFIVIDHGDGTASITGHSVMVAMLDATECMISSPTVEIHEDDPRTFDVDSLIRIERWQE